MRKLLIIFEETENFNPKPQWFEQAVVHRITSEGEKLIKTWDLLDRHKFKITEVEG